MSTAADGTDPRTIRTPRTPACKRCAALTAEVQRLRDKLCNATDCTVETCDLCGEFERRAEKAERERDEAWAKLARLNGGE